MTERVHAALERAAAGGPFAGRCDTVRRDVVIGDPQAPIRTFFEILDRHGLLGTDGTLAEGAHLTSVGDHFDYGGLDRAADAARDGLLLLGWLAAHDASRTTILAGNHDLGRVGELAAFDDTRFATAQRRAARVYGSGDAEAEAAFLAAYPELPSSEVAARDFSAFTVAQRELVTHLLRSRRMRMARAVGSKLIVHAGVTRNDVEGDDASSIAAWLDQRLDAAVDAWTDGPLVIEDLHYPGNASDGEGGGVLYHRPAWPHGDTRWFSGSYRRRFDPMQLPRGVLQIVGHIRDRKCRALLGVGGAAIDGPLRVLRVPQRTYEFGTVEAVGEDEAAMVFVDGGMGYGGAPRYELLDLTTMQPVA